MKYFDIHSHLHSDFFKDDSGKIIIEMQKEGVGTISVGVDFRDSQKAVELAQKHENIWATIGIHPTTREKFEEEKFQQLLDQNKDKIVGIGECGLDYYWLHHDLKKGKINLEELERQKERQQKLFVQQINFAQENDLPLMLHVRPHKNADAYHDVLKILDKQGGLASLSKVNFHFFTEGPEIAREIVKRNWNVSFPGVITFADLDETIKIMPLEKIMADTDSPFAAPTPHRGKINNPLYVKEIIKKIAEVKNISERKCNQQLLKNTKKFFKINF